MKKNIPVFFAASLSLFAASCTTTSQIAEISEAPSIPALRVEGTQLVDASGNEVVLRGISYGWHNWWPRFYNKESVKWFKDDWGVDVVRAPLGIHHKEPKRTYNAHPEKAVEIVSKVIDGAIENGIYVIIDFHSHHLELDLAKKFFADMATQYGKYPNVIYEIFNEPVHQSWEEVKAYSEEVIEVIREIDPDNIILVGSPHWDQDLHIVADDPIEDVTNVMYTLHYYAATHGEYLRERGDYALEKGIPIFISESAGMEASGDGPMDYEAWQVWRDWAEDRKISWITWSVSDKNETCSFLYPRASSKGGWSEKDLRESAQATRRILREKAGLD